MNKASKLIVPKHIWDTKGPAAEKKELEKRLKELKNRDPFIYKNF